MEKRLLEIEGVGKSHPHLTKHRLEMTRMSLAGLKEKTGVGTLDVQNRMVDFGVDAYWLSHEPWIVPEPLRRKRAKCTARKTSTTGFDTIAHIVAEARSDPDRVKSAPHSQAIAQLKPDWLEDPARWAMTWRAFQRKARRERRVLERNAIRWNRARFHLIAFARTGDACFTGHDEPS